MLGILALILLLVWIGLLALHLLGAFVYLFLLAAVIFGIAHFVTGGNSNKSTT